MDRVIERLRGRIDAVDRKLLALLSERGKLVEDVGRRKRKIGATFHQPGRERAVIARLVAENRGPYADEAIEAVFREVMSASLALESPLTVAAVDGAARIAARRRFGSSARVNAESGPDDVLDAVARGFARYGVLAVEDTLGGFHGAELDALADADLAVTGEIVVHARGVTTRSLVIGGDEQPPTGDDQTSTVIVPRDEPGAIATVLGVFGRHGVNLRRIEGRPLDPAPRASKKWAYRFFVDLAGHHEDPPLAKALAELRRGGALVRLLGSYPRGR